MKTFKEFKGKKKPKAKKGQQNDHEELEVNRNVGSDDEMNEAKDTTINDIARAIKTEKLPLIDLRKILDPMFGKKNVYFSMSRPTHFRIKTKGKTIIIVNKSSADNPDAVVGTIAIGYEG